MLCLCCVAACLLELVIYMPTAGHQMAIQLLHRVLRVLFVEVCMFCLTYVCNYWWLLFVSVAASRIIVQRTCDAALVPAEMPPEGEVLTQQLD